MNLIWLQFIGTTFGVAQVLLARKNNVHNYLFGIISVLVSIWVLYESKLYADILLHLYYLVMSIYGWFYWKFGRKKQAAPISWSSIMEHVKALAIVAGCFALMSWWLAFHTNSDVPFWDAAVSAFAWSGMWLMAKRKMENWIYLNVSNAIAIPLLLYKELYIYAGLTVFLFAVGTSGYLKWRKIIQNEKREIYAEA
ncbi:nicotinamide mononucleotide transporter [Salinimicrobium catena]|uniref:Nicotinamide riboside transporter PnuC n=1 Tax=Salinimicrobium catena TaxID=390640 RepID=A0A1H5MRA0_9FLAO|nr:nicotinamide riboside transporter PnuC [Salinimicrobium catena]SDL27876.1 nicotinamide mononucleotide transporter [Salinimicrobium catena]SEE91690.1 nicotinamide mononucleotide transporter [Salinimicrobium catena]